MLDKFNYYREARTLGPIRSFEMQISPTDPNHFYIGTDGVSIEIKN